MLALAALLYAPVSGAPLRHIPDHVWPMYQYSADREAVFAADAWSVSWRASLGSRSNGGLSIVGNAIYAESFDQGLYAFDARTGRLRWRAQLSNVAMSAPIVANGLVIVGTGDNQMGTSGWTMQRPQGDEVDAFDAASGQEIWRFPTAGEDMPTGVYIVARGVPEYIFSNGDNHVYALNATNGRLLWRAQAMGINAMSDLATDGRRVFGIAEYSWQRLFDDEAIAGDSPAKARAWTWSIDPSTGWFDWRSPFGVADGGVTLSSKSVLLQSVRLVSPRGTAAVARSREIGWQKLLDEAQWSTELYALDTASGQPLWRYEDSPGIRSYKTSGTFSTTGTIVGNTLYDPLQISRHVAAFDAYNGHLYWMTATKAPVKMAVLYKAGRLYAGDTDGNFYVFNAQTGAIEQTIQFPSPFTPSPPVIVGDTLYVVNGSTLFAVRLSDLDRGVLSPTA